MASPIKIRADADFAALLKAAKNAGKSLDELIEDFDDVEDASQDATRTAERGFKEMDRDSDKAGRSIERNLKDGFDEAASEADGTAREVAASFDGSAESIGEGFQELAANAFAGFGPAGAVAGAAAAAAIGAAMAADTAWVEEQQARVEGLYGVMLDEQTKLLESSMLLAQAQELIGDKDKFQQAQEYAEVLGLDMNTVIGALIGDTDDLAAAQKRVQEKLAATNDEVSSFSSTQGKAATDAQKLNSQLQKANNAFLDVEDSANTAGKKYDAFAGFASRAKAETSKAGDEVFNLNEQIGRIPATKDTTVKVRVDDSEYQRWVRTYAGQMDNIIKFGRPVY